MYRSAISETEISWKHSFLYISVKRKSPKEQILVLHLCITCQLSNNPWIVYCNITNTLTKTYTWFNKSQNSPTSTSHQASIWQQSLQGNPMRIVGCWCCLYWCLDHINLFCNYYISSYMSLSWTARPLNFMHSLFHKLCQIAFFCVCVCVCVGISFFESWIGITYILITFA